MKYLFLLIIVFTFFSMFSCKQEKKTNSEINLKIDMQNIISAYIEEYPQFNTFLLQSTKGLDKNERVTTQEGFLLGPGYKFLIEKYNPTCYVDILDKRVFYISAIDELVQREKIKWIIKNDPDSMEMSNGWIIKDFSELFINRAIYLYYNKLGYLEVNTKPDTIFAPRFIGSSIKFENIKD